MDPTGPASLNGRYTLECTLRGHRGAILCLATTDDGSILASGGGYKPYELHHIDLVYANTLQVRMV
jgi:hypothetical protein